MRKQSPLFWLTALAIFHLGGLIQALIGSEKAYVGLLPAWVWALLCGLFTGSVLSIYFLRAR